MNIPFFPIVQSKDFSIEEEERKQQVIKRFVEQRKDAYQGVPEWVWEAQLNFALKTPSEAMLYAIHNPPTFIKSHGCTIHHLTCGLHTTDDQGFEGQVCVREDGSKWFCRWFESDMGFDREVQME